jgi:hypothetical protein
MQKPTNKTIQRRKLVVQREVISELTRQQLGKVAGGWTQDWPCQGASDQPHYTCQAETIG